eukprot:561456_1
MVSDQCWRQSRRSKDTIPNLMSFYNHVNAPMKIYTKNENSWGTFGIAIHSDFFENLIGLFGIEGKKLNDLPLDEYFSFLKYSAKKRSRSFNIHPTLVLPDVTSSSLRKDSIEMDSFLKHQTTDHNASHFSKYWNLRFSHERQSYVKRINATTPSFEELVRHSPSQRFLKKDQK